MGRSSYHSDGIRCTICGRFISYEALENGTAGTAYTPDTDFTNERTQFFHQSCVRR